MRLLLRDILFCFSIVFFLSSANAESKDNEGQLFQAAFIYNFAKFTHWPERNINTQSLVLCTEGSDKLVGDLHGLAGRVIRDRTLIIKSNESHAKNNLCHILYIAGSEKNSINKILNKVKNKPILTISALKKFEENGGMIQLKTQKSQTRIVINVARARVVGLEISSRLLILAKVIGNEEDL